MHHLQVKDLSSAYGPLTVLKGVNFTLAKGETAALIGPSGSGKSTVLRVLMGLNKPTGGEVLIDGAALDYSRPASVRAARERMAIVFQQYNLFQNMSVLRNVTIAPVKIKGRPRKEVEAEAERLLSKVGLADKHHAYPDELSGGQQQRVAIARALALRPQILLLDEVTSALDPELVNEVLDTIRGLAADGMTMLIVSHEMAFVREVATKVVMMDEGLVVEQGPPEQIFGAPKTDRAREFVGKILRH
ncbi:MAG: amino acid ABC transporter ATP-binding protein [Alphaproteobacteria bacterium]|nr:amino acid ABC transporter ATP-binding protein [Alphaproteobacteria bacterium]